MIEDNAGLIGNSHGASADLVVVLIIENQRKGAGLTLLGIYVDAVLPSPPVCSVSVHDNGGFLLVHFGAVRPPSRGIGIKRTVGGASVNREVAVKRRAFADGCFFL